MFYFKLLTPWKFCCFGLLLLLIGFIACEKEELGPVSDQNANDTTTTGQDTVWRGVFVSNEGNFKWGNGSLSFYNPDSQTIQHRVFREINDSKLGDVVQSMSIINDQGYIVVNNSQKIEVVDMKSLKRIATIGGMQSPRYIQQVSQTKAYVTDLFAEKLSIIDLTSHRVTGHISLSGWTEEMVLIDNSVYVTNMDSAAVYEIQADNDEVVDTIPVGVEPNSIEIGANGNLWVLCSGGFSEEKPSLFQIAPAENQVLQEFTFADIESSPDNLSTSPDGSQLYYLNGGVYGMSVNDGSLPRQPLISANGRTIYGMDVSPSSGQLYVSDAKNFTENGDIYRYTGSGGIIDSFSTGLIPGHFTFF